MRLFHATHPRSINNRPIQIKPIALGSGELIDELLSGRRQAHLASPASAIFVALGNAESRAKTGKDLLSHTQNLVLSPVVVAMWKPMAEALGWGRQPIGWAELLAIARKPEGWAGFGHAEWGSFKLGHTHPLYSNSGLITILAEIYAATGKTAGLSESDLARPQVANMLEGIEHAIVHYGSSTGFFGRKMYSEGPSYLSAAVLYENMVIESYDHLAEMPFPLVAIYPREGTIWSDHPVGIVNRAWVTPEHQEAAQQLILFLLAPEQQNLALAFGFRPAEPSILIGNPINPAHGVDASQPKTTLQVPSPSVIHAALSLWQKHKKLSDVVLALDISGSMKEQGKWTAARDGAKTFLSLLGDEDRISILVFNHELRWLCSSERLGATRIGLVQKLDGMFAEGGTALYDAIAAGQQHLLRNDSKDRIKAVVVLSDGDDQDSKLKLDQLNAILTQGGETQVVRIFTIGYGSDARADILKDIAFRTKARFDVGTTATIREVFKDISSFF